MHFHGPIVRPQTDARSLFIEVTAGCSHNCCTFCNFYHDTPFMVAPLEQIEEDLKEAKRKWPDVKEIWASGGNPFVLPTERQIEVWDLIKRYFPNARISTYAIVTDFKKKSVEDIMAIKAHGLGNVMIGIETGDDEVLSFVNKGYTSRDILDAARKLDEAQLDYRIIYLGGLAGKGKLVESARKTAAVINQMHPYYLMYTNVSVLPGTKLYDQMLKGEWVESSERERIEEMRELVSDIDVPITVNTGTSANSVTFVAKLPEEKEDIVKQLDTIIGRFDESVERDLARWRHSMTSV